MSSSEESSEQSSNDTLEQLRVLSHRLSNSLEVIMQAQYLLQHSRESFLEAAKAEVENQGVTKQKVTKKEVAQKEGTKQEDQKWTAMIGNAAAEAAETNRQIRDAVRHLSALRAAEANPLRSVPASGQKNRGPSR